MAGNKADELLAALREALQDPVDRVVAGLFQELDEWLSEGGFLPEDWSRYEINR